MANSQTQQESTWHYVGQNTFGSFLKRARTRRSLSRHSLAVMSGIQERRLTQIELNNSPPSYRDLKGIATALKIPEQDLLQAAGCIKRGQGE